MKVVHSFPYKVMTHEHVEIPMADGCRLAARIWLPESAEYEPVPAIFEYIPYRKRDLTRLRDSVMHPYLAGHGYACVRVDLRGSGDSEGVMVDQYRQQELDDGAAVIAWLAEQPWCDGNVGMMGISWGGFNGLQVASLAPPALRAVISACSTDDLYLDNMHYMGGCLLTDNLSEATTMFTANSSPPDPDLVGDRWREMWMQRLKGSGLWLDTWLQHQYRDEYWKHGSVSEHYAAIRCPVMLVGGWADGYTNAIFRLLEHLQVPRLGLIGPWGHKYPHQGVPGPAIGFLQEALRWWDHWLKGRDTGILEEPMLRAWMQDSVPPTTFYKARPGRWVAETVWPAPRIRQVPYDLDSHRILFPGDEPCPADAAVQVQSPLSVGLMAGKWCSYTYAPDLPHDQRQEDGGALVFQSAPLEQSVEILGAPVVELELACNRPVAMVAARLSDVAPDGKATRVTYGLFNLTHHRGHGAPEKLQPGRVYRVRVPMNNIGQNFPVGHRLRLSLSTSYWALAWPPPEPVRLTVYPAKSRLLLPQREPHPRDSAVRFEEAEGAPPTPVTILEPPEHNWLVHVDLALDRSVLEVIKDEGLKHLEETDTDVANRIWNWYSFQGDDFDSLRGETRTERIFRRGDWSVRTTTRTVLTADKSYFYIHAELDAWEGDCRVYTENWQRKIPRDFL
ncbi:CocE/NonD family hydrolase [Microbulbifer elongatus]|uniref:CocE/NonD family hydrolase n=1 Tax=Microbulbifer elongatus TaxID=86173 RepID=UPI001F4B718C|nr:CocE/NonD family hydrolase [Microbulbifer elongatus]